MAVFDGVRYSLSPSLSPTRRSELAAVLDLNGAAPHPPYTHLIALPTSHAHKDATNNSTIKLVTDRWVDRSIVMGKCQPEQYYSPDPAMIFSGVVACATDLSAPDLEVLSAGITALGGQWRVGLTRDVTHLFALRAGSDKYNTALHFASQTHMCILTPHWFDDAVRLGRRIPETPYSWPDPLVLRPGVTLNLDDDHVAADGKRKRKPPADAEAGGSTNPPNEGEQIRIWAGRRILLSASLELGDGSRSAIKAGIRRAGGVIVPITEDADEEMEEKAVDECDVLITRWRSGKSYFKAARASLLIGTLSWLFSVESSGTLHSPFDSLLWYPTPRGGIPDLIDCEISVTNYTGAVRDYLKRLIVLVGAKFTPSMSQSNKVLVAGFQPSPKTTRAHSWSIPVVNHTWLEDCVVEWRGLTVGLERYIVYPPGVDFGKILMTGHDAPSQSVPTPRLSGGAVPGGRGVGVIDVEEEELRDAGYRARVRKGEPVLGLLRMQELANDTTVDEVSMLRSEGDVPTDSRARAPSQTRSVKKTPSSSARAKGWPLSIPKATSATGAFVDHVIELPTEDGEEDTGRTRRSLIDRKRARTSLPGTSQDASGSSPLAPRTAREAEIVTCDLEGSPRGGKDEGKGKGRGESRDPLKPRKRPIHGEEEEDAIKPVPFLNSKRRPVQHKPSIQADRVEVSTEESALVQANNPRRRAKGLVIGSDLGTHSDPGEGEGSEGSVPPRRATGAGSTTPVKSGMKPRPRSTSRPRRGSIPGGENEDEVRVVAKTGAGTGKQSDKTVKPTRSYPEVVIISGGKQKREKTKEKETEKVIPRRQSRTRTPSPTPPKPKSSRVPKRRLSVLVPSVPKDYFSSQSVRNAMETEDDSDQGRENEENSDASAIPGYPGHKRLAPAASMRAVAAETSTSTSKRAKPSPAKRPVVVIASENGEKSMDQPKTKAKTKPRGSIRTNDDDEAMNMDEDNSTSLIADTSIISVGRGGPRRSAASKASTRLREKIMPDVVSFEKEQKQAKRRRSTGGLSVVSLGDDEEREVVGKKRKVTVEDDDEEERAEVEDVVLAQSVKTKSKPNNGKGKVKGTVPVGSDGGMDERTLKNKLNGSHSKKGARAREKETTTIRLMTTGVVLSDEVVKRLTKLGVQMTTKPSDCTHLVAKGIVRTEKFLCAISVSPYILTEEWANASSKGGKLLPENDYLLSDSAAEGKWAFKFEDAMVRAKGPDGGSSLFKHMTFYVTPKVPVDGKLLKNVVSAGGGQVQIATTPTARIFKGKANRYIISCPEDKAIWRPLAQEGFKVYSPELVLRGALRQEIEWEKEECLVAG